MSRRGFHSFNTREACRRQRESPPRVIVIEPVVPLPFEGLTETLLTFLEENHRALMRRLLVREMMRTCLSDTSEPMKE